MTIQLRKLTDPAVPQKTTTSPGLLFYTVDPTIVTDGPAGTSFRIPYSVMFSGYALLAQPNTFTSNQTVVGSVTATSFVGAGDGITGLTNTGATVWIDEVNGNDATGARGNSAKPFLTPTAAQTAAQAGDLIHVRPGSYAVSAQLGKNGVNWYFDPGTTVTFSEAETTVSGLWLGSGFGLSYRVRGYGNFVRTATARVSGPFPCIVSLSSTTGDVLIEGNDLTVTDTSLAPNPPRVIHQTGGSLTVRCRDMTCNGAVGTGGSDTTGAGIWWQNGTLDVVGRRVVTTAWGLYSEVTGAPTGDAYAHFDDWRCNLACVYCAGTQGTAAIWTTGKTFRNLLYGAAVFSNGAERVYVEAEKLFGSILNNSSGLLYVRSQKVSPVLASNPLLSSVGTGLSWVEVLDWDSAGCAANVFSVSGGTVDVIGGVVRGDASSLGASVSGGTARFHGVRIDTSNNTTTANPLTVSGGATPELASCTLVAGGSRDAITAATAQAVITDGGPFTNTQFNANITPSPRRSGPGLFVGSLGLTNGTKTLQVSSTTTFTTNDTEVVFEQTGDALGTSRARVRNRSGTAGLIVENPAIDLSELVLQPSSGSGNARNVRLENRAAISFTGLTPELQFGAAGSPSLCVADAKTADVQTNPANPVVREMRNQSATVAGRLLADQTATWVSSTDTARKARVVHSAHDGNAGTDNAREYLRGEASGTAAMIGFLGAAAVAQQANASQAGINAVTDANAKAALQAIYNLLKNYGLAPATA